MTSAEMIKEVDEQEKKNMEFLVNTSFEQEERKVKEFINEADLFRNEWSTNLNKPQLNKADTIAANERAKELSKRMESYLNDYKSLIYQGKLLTFKENEETIKKGQLGSFEVEPIGEIDCDSLIPHIKYMQSYTTYFTWGRYLNLGQVR